MSTDPVPKWFPKKIILSCLLPRRQCIGTCIKLSLILICDSIINNLLWRLQLSLWWHSVNSLCHVFGSLFEMADSRIPRANKGKYHFFFCELQKLLWCYKFEWRLCTDIVRSNLFSSFCFPALCAASDVTWKFMHFCQNDPWVPKSKWCSFGTS